MNKTIIKTIIVILAVSLTAAVMLGSCGSNKGAPDGTTASGATAIFTVATTVPAPEGQTSADGETSTAAASDVSGTNAGPVLTTAATPPDPAASGTSTVPSTTTAPAAETTTASAPAATAAPETPAATTPTPTEAPVTDSQDQASSTTNAADGVFTNRDMAQTVDISGLGAIQVSGGSGYTISSEGIYVFTGTASGYTITVAAPDDAKVQIVLNGVNITNTDFPAIYVKTADKVFVTTAAPSSLAVTGTFTTDGSVKTDAVIFSKQDLTMNGTSTLTLTAKAGNGVTCKDDFKATGGTYTVTAAKHGIEANDSVSIGGGSYTIDAGTDGVHCVNNDDNTKGKIYVSGGELKINAKSDGMEALSTLTVDGGSINITASEGLEATQITVNDGTVIISASDDGMNASQKSSAFTVVITINGGDITITMGAGDTDAVDANGSIYINGGKIDITAPTSAFDFDNVGQINGGTVIVNGQQITQLTNQMMGGPGGMGGMGGFGGRGGW